MPGINTVRSELEFSQFSQLLESCTGDITAVIPR